MNALNSVTLLDQLLVEGLNYNKNERNSTYTIFKMKDYITVCRKICVGTSFLQKSLLFSFRKLRDAHRTSASLRTKKSFFYSITWLLHIAGNERPFSVFRSEINRK